MRRTSWLIFALVLLVACPPLLSQDTSAGGQSSATKPSESTPPTPPAATFSSDVKVVNVLASVRDKHGQIDNNLTKDDFRLEQDGHPQTIRYFTRETDLPLKLGLLVDTSMSQRRMIDQERTASYGFLNELMRPDEDKAFVIHFDWGTELLQDMTSSHQKLEAALDKLDMPHPSFSNTGGNDPNGGGGGHQRHGGSTTLYDAVFLASDELMQKQQGRKAIILLTDGVDEGSRVTLDRAIEAAQRSNTLVYSILYADPEAYGHTPIYGPSGGMGRHGGWPGGPGGGYPRQESHPDGKKVLQRMSKETGGRFFEVSKKQPIDQIYKQIEDELRNQYNLGYSPEKAVAGNGYHKITVTTTNKDLIVQAREGYYAQN